MDEKNLREQMVRTQLLPRGIEDAAVLTAMRKVARHLFVPGAYRDQAYEDRPCPIGEGQTISQPYIVALMSEALKLKKRQRVLEIGTGCGYQTAILAELAGQVVTIERIASLSRTAQMTLAGLGYDNIEFIIADGTQDFQEDLGAFDAIMITAATPNVAEHWLAMLKKGGRLLAPVGGRDGQMLTLYTNTEDAISEREIGRCMFVPLIGEYGFN